MSRIRSRRSFALTIAGCLLIAAGPGAADQGQRQKPPEKPTLVAQTRTDREEPEAPKTVVRLHFEVIGLALPPEQVSRINGSAEPVDLEALHADGVKGGYAHVKYVFDTPLVVGQATELQTSSRVPFERRVTRNKEGATQRQVEYQSTGCIVKLGTAWADDREPDRVALSVKVDVSDMVIDSPVPITDDLAAPIFSTVKQELSTVALLATDTYFSTLSSQPTAAGEQATAYAHLYRLRLDREPKE